MNRSRISVLVLSAFAASSSFAGLEVTPVSASTSTQPSTMSASSKKTILTIETIGSVNTMSIGGSISGGSQSFDMDGSASGTSLVNGVAVGGTFMTSDAFGLEANFGLVSKKFDDISVTMNGQSSSSSSDESSKMLATRLTGMGRFYPTTGFSLGAGAYSSMFVGNIRNTDSNGVTTSQSFSDSGFNRLDYGAVIGARGEIPLSAGFELTIDARYFLGLANLYDNAKIEAEAPGLTSELSAKTRDFQFGAGVGFLF